MRYMGSKRRMAKEILQIILAEPRPVYIEPFAGSMAVIENVGKEIKRYANDINPYLITMYHELVNKGWEPPFEMTREEYDLIRDDPHSRPMALVAFAAFGCSFGGKWFGGYAQSKDSKGNPRNHALESRNNLLKQRDRLAGTIFLNLDYRSILPPPNAILYLDPPYTSTTKYKDDFDHAEFWNWAREHARKGAKVFVSEYEAPDDFKCVYEKEQTTTVCRKGYKKAVEKLFTLTS